MRIWTQCLTCKMQVCGRMCGTPRHGDSSRCYSYTCQVYLALVTKVLVHIQRSNATTYGDAFRLQRNLGFGWCFAITRHHHQSISRPRAPHKLFCSPLGITITVAHVPMLLTNYFASRRAGEDIRCEDFKAQATPPSCRDAHSDVVLWASWTSFFSNTVVSVVLVSRLALCAQYCVLYSVAQWGP
jgi:hypothetical protein